MILDLLCARTDRGPGPFALIVILILGVLAGIGTLIHGCAPKPTLEQVHISAIQQSLGGAGSVRVQQVYPPAGPWTLVKQGSRYYRATVTSTARTVWVEAYVSKWTIATVVAGSNEAVYRYRYSGETKVLGRTFYPYISQ